MILLLAFSTWLFIYGVVAGFSGWMLPVFWLLLVVMIRECDYEKSM